LYNSPYTLKVIPKSTKIRIMGHSTHGGDEKSIPSQLPPAVMVPRGACSGSRTEHLNPDRGFTSTISVLPGIKKVKFSVTGLTCLEGGQRYSSILS
jgi:hypothetical protein